MSEPLFKRGASVDVEADTLIRAIPLREFVHGHLSGVVPLRVDDFGAGPGQAGFRLTYAGESGGISADAWEREVARIVKLLRPVSVARIGTATRRPAVSMIVADLGCLVIL